MSDHTFLPNYVAKLERRGRLPDSDREALLALPGHRRDFSAKETIIAPGTRTAHCVIVGSGLVSRIKRMASSSQIVAFHIAGDAIDLQSLFFRRADHEIYAHSVVETYWVRHEDILALTRDNKAAANALWLDTLIDSSIFREWTANIGQRSARDRVGHFFLELAARLADIGEGETHKYSLPVTQSSLADALGMSLVHLNKTLALLKSEGLIEMNRQIVTIKDKERLASRTGFDGAYLHLDSTNLD